MKLTSLLTFLLCLSGCAGVARYTVEPVVVDTVVACCKVTIFNTKDIGHIRVIAERQSNGDIHVSLEETGVDASTPMAVQGETVSDVVDTAASVISPIGGLLD